MTAARPPGRLKRAARIAVTRPHLFGSALLGVLVWLALALVPDLRWSTRSILAWDSGVAVFIGTMMFHMVGRSADDMAARAARQDEGQGLILGLMLVTSAASLWSVAGELHLAQGDHGPEKALRVGLAAITVAGTWFMMQLVMALHYAHEYYGPGRPGGLAFPGGEDPDYWDFVHFAVVIGAAAQTADIAFTSRALRRMGTLHSVVAFTFNTVVLALSINLLASLL